MNGVKNELFLKASNFTLDPYWIQVFQDASKHKFPKGCSIDSQQKQFYIKKGKFNTIIKLETDPQLLFCQVKKCFQEKLDVKSNLDNMLSIVESDTLSTNFQETLTKDWANIKQKKIKESFIRKYILELKEYYFLTPEETKNLTIIIKIGFSFNWITNENVVYSKNRILQIKNLYYDSETRLFDIDKPIIKVKREYKPKKNKMSVLWKKFLEKQYCDENLDDVE